MKKSLLVRLGVWVAASLFTVIMCLFFPQKLRQMLGREPDYQQKAFAGRQLVASVYGQYIFSDQLYLALKDYLQTRKLQWEQLSDERKKNIFTALLYDLQNAELMSIKAELNKQQVVQDVQLRDKLLQDYSQRFADDNSRDRALAEVNLQWPQLQARLESILLQAARLQQISPDFEQALQQQQASYLKQNAGQILQAATYNCRLLSIPKSDSAQAGAVIGEYELTFDNSRANAGTLSSVTVIAGGAYDPATGALDHTVAGGPLQISIGMLGDTSGLTQLSDSFSPTSIAKNGSAVGNLTSVEIDDQGMLTATYDTGLTRRLYQIPLVDVPNINGLTALNDQVYETSISSGSFYLWDAGEGPAGTIAGFAREESTTDLAAELTSLIQTQRAYTSSAKIIQTVDEMLQETTNIKR